VQSRGLWEGSRLGRADGGLGRAAAWGGRQLEGGCGLGEAGVLGKGGGRAPGAGRAGRPALGSAGGQAAARWAAQAGRRPRIGRHRRAGGRVLGSVGGQAAACWDALGARRGASTMEKTLARRCVFFFFFLFFVVGFAFQEAIHIKKTGWAGGRIGALA